MTQKLNISGEGFECFGVYLADEPSKEGLADRPSNDQKSETQPNKENS